MRHPQIVPQSLRYRKQPWGCLSALAVLMLAGCATPERLIGRWPVIRSAPPLPVVAPPMAVPDAMVPAPTPVLEAIPQAVIPPASETTAMPAPVLEHAPEPAPPPAPLPVPFADSKLTLLQAWVAEQQRLYRVAAPLLIRNTELCPQITRKILGFTAKNKYSYSNDFIDVASTGLGLDDRLQVASVLPGSGAMRAGISPGDILLAAGGQPLPQGPAAERASSSVIADAIAGTSTLELTVLNGGDSTIVEVALTPACAIVMDLGNSADVNSYSDGRRVMVTRGMLGFVQSDEELAFVLARAIASNIVSPTPRPTIAAVIERLHTLNAVAPVLPDDAIIAPATTAHDAAADRLALYLLARAGYGIDSAPGFWERLASSYPAEMKNSHAARHTPIADRLAVINRNLQVIKAKQKSGQPLKP